MFSTSSRAKLPLLRKRRGDRAHDHRRTRVVLVADVRHQARPHLRVLTRVRGRDPLELLGGEKGAAGFDQLAVALFVSMFARPPLEVGVEGPQEGEERRQREQLL